MKKMIHAQGKKIIACALVMILASWLVFSNQSQVNNANSPKRTISLVNEEIDYQSQFERFDSVEITQENNIAVLHGTQIVAASLFEEIDNVSEDDIEDLAGAEISYDMSYDSESNIITISAEMKNELGEVKIDQISGVAFFNENGEIDAVMNVDGEGVLLSEMRDYGMIENCGWFTSLIKATAVAVAVVAAVVAVAAVCVCTCGAAAPALVAVGVGVSTSAVAASACAIAGYATVTAAIAAGVYVAASAIETIDFHGVKYKAEVLTEAIAAALSPKDYFIALASSDGCMMFCAVPITKDLAVSIMQANTVVSVYTVLPGNARSVAQIAGNNMSPIHENGHQIGYFAHYHLGNLSVRGETHSACHSHAFYGLPRII